MQQKPLFFISQNKDVSLIFQRSAAAAAAAAASQLNINASAGEINTSFHFSTGYISLSLTPFIMHENEREENYFSFSPRFRRVSL